VTPPKKKKLGGFRLCLSDDPTLCATFTGLAVFLSSTSDDQPFYVIVTLYRFKKNHQDWGQTETACERFARDDKELGSQLGEANTRRAAS
jgi:hypothetical protein